MNTRLRPKIIILFFARLLGFFKISAYLTRSRLRILCYHGGLIGDEDGFNPKLFCSAKTLSARMKWMQAYGFQFVTLDDGVKQQTATARRNPLRAVVTFDDGWYSTGSELIPVLSSLGIPSTLYLSTENFIEGWPILNVTVRYTIWKAGQRSVSIQGWGAEVDGVYDLGNPGERSRLATGIVAAIHSEAHERGQVCAVLDRFASDLGVPSATLQIDSRRFDYMTPTELLEIAAKGCSIESHGHVHHYPRNQPLKFAEDLRQCENIIVGMGLNRPTHYCYPSGSFDALASDPLAEAGISSATTCIPGLVDVISGAHRYYLPRFLDGENVHSIEFEAEMSGFSEMVRNAVRRIKRARAPLYVDLDKQVRAEA